MLEREVNATGDHKNRGISHLTTGCLRLIHVRYGALNGLKSEIEKCPKSRTRPALDIDEAQCLRSVKLRNTQQAQSSAVPPRTGRQRGLRPRTVATKLRCGEPVSSHASSSPPKMLHVKSVSPWPPPRGPAAASFKIDTWFP